MMILWWWRRWSWWAWCVLGGDDGADADGYSDSFDGTDGNHDVTDVDGDDDAHFPLPIGTSVWKLKIFAARVPAHVLLGYEVYPPEESVKPLPWSLRTPPIHLPRNMWGANSLEYILFIGAPNSRRTYGLARPNNHKPQTLNPTPITPNPKPQTQTPNPKL